MGASKKNCQILLLQKLYIGFYGSIIGIFVGIILIFYLIFVVQKKFKCSLLPSVLNLSLVALVCLLVGVLVGALSSFNSARKINKTDVYLTMREYRNVFKN